MSPLLILAAGWIAVGAADVIQSEMYNLYTGVAVGDTVFQSPAVGSSQCASICQQQDGSKAFTFNGKICTCQRNVWPASTTQQARVFVKEVSGPCLNYKVIDDIRRDVNHGNRRICDKGMAYGWYRFLLNGANAVMPTRCTPPQRCGTRVSYWLNLKGQKLPNLGQQISATACGSLDWCCKGPINVAVHNCGGYFVYLLRSARWCTSAYCAQRV
ncbi:hypothetical protein V1264_008397 [Littorina saxatilis]|uniref:Uncharacterized protein n=1 Tax=Littorina saxatilis TaxID=31220 RepID=A0AAN9AT47_9CAEN